MAHGIDETVRKRTLESWPAWVSPLVTVLDQWRPAAGTDNNDLPIHTALSKITLAGGCLTGSRVKASENQLIVIDTAASKNE